MRSIKLAGTTLLIIALLSTMGSASAAIKISRIQFDPAGADTQSKLNQEYVVFKNTGVRRVSITGWTLRDTSSHRFVFPVFRLRPHHRVAVHTGSGRNTATDLYWRSHEYIWNNDGDTATLRRGNGSKADTCHYGGAGSAVAC